MALFQKSVVNKYLKTLDSTEVEKAFLKFKQFYGNRARLENIRLLKEENYQEGFLREIFVEVLGYTINPDENYNLTTEFKNLTDAKKADGAILMDGKAIGVIELKSTKTTSLESITEQAFNYKNHQPNCRYIITSNFEKIRFYIDNATDFEEFNLFTLSEDEFKILYLILSKENIFNEIPLKLKAESVLHEENISKQLYWDYSNFKRKIFENLVKNNPQYDKLTLFKKSQKLLDRFLFILFGEDSGLVPPNAVSKIIDQWKTLNELDEPATLYSRFVKFFHHLNVGHKYKTFEVPAYNGGLFREDEILDNVKIDDDVLLEDSLKLSAYDFQTEIDVNILGHIFENSLNEIEELTAELEGKPVDKKKTKRKKEGVYYTPKYITKYIVENTVGELCNQKKKELNLDKIDISVIQNSRTKQGKLTRKAKDLLERLKTYSDYLLSLKILDPACGSGAFLNQALEFLIEEHQFIDEYRRQLEQDSLGLFDIKKSILENNIYGVDINEESVEIAKLSLWLRTAERGRKLSDLSNNIKCGNSLIDDPEVAKEKAFKWEEEFPDIMANGGFDVVIGNPPWGAKFESKEISFIKSKNSDIIVRMTDSFMFFVNLSMKLTSKKSYVGLIVPDVFLYQVDNLKLRKKLLSTVYLSKIINLGDGVFENVARPSCIITFSTKKLKHAFVGNINKNSLDIDSFKLTSVSTHLFHTLPNYIFATDNFIGYKLLEKFKNLTLKDIVDDDGIQRGISPDYKDAFIVNSQIISKYMLESNKIKPTITGGRDLKRYQIIHKDKFIIYTRKNDIPSDIPNIISYLERFKENITCKEVLEGKHPFYSLHRARNEKIFLKKEKIIGVITGDRIVTAIDNRQLYPTDGLYLFSARKGYSNYFLVALLNSKLYTYFYRLISQEKNRTLSQIKPKLLEKLPILQISSDLQKPFTQKSIKLTNLNEIKYKKIQKFINRVTSNFNSIEITAKIKNIFAYDFTSFLNEIKNQKAEISLNQQDEWEDYLNSYKSDINSLQYSIEKIENEIDQMVYKLYGLTDKEIQIVENSFKEGR